MVIPDPPSLAEARRVANIATRDNAERAALFLRGVRQHIRTIKAGHKQVRADLRTALQKLTTLERETLKPWANAEKVVNDALLTWQVQERERVRLEAQRALEAAEAAARVQRDEQARALEAAAAEAPTKTIARDLQRQAKQVRQAPVIPTAVPTVEPTKLDGVSLIEDWGAEVVDLMTLVKAVAAGKVPLDALQGNQDWLDDRADALRTTFSIPGVRAVKSHRQTARGL